MSDPKVYTPADVQAALKDRLVKFEEQLKDLHARELRKDQHMEPGVHEAGGPGAPQHMEPGGHENHEMPMPQSPPEQPVGSASGIPQGQLQDLCPMCGQPDMPGQCQCLNGGGNEGLDQPLVGAGGVVPYQGGVDPNPTQPGRGVQPLALNEQMGYPGADPTMKKEWVKPWEKEKESSCEHGGTCKSCGNMKKDADFVDIKGKQKTVGVVGDMPDDKKSKEMSAGGSGGEVKKGKGLAKVAVPMAKPPGGGTGLAPKPPAMAKPAAPKVGAPGVAPKPMGKGADITPKDKKAMASHAAHDSFKAASKAPAAAAQPKMIPKPPSHYDPKEYKRGELSKSMGVCLFCGNGEHAGMCGLAKNIQTSLAKVASPLFTGQPKLKPGAKGLGHVATSPELGNVLGHSTKTSAGPAQSGNTVAGTPDRKKKKVIVHAFDAAKHPSTKPPAPAGTPAIKGEK